MPLAVPGTPVFLGLTAYCQGIVLDAAGSAGGVFAATQGLRFTIGN